MLAREEGKKNKKSLKDKENNYIREKTKNYCCFFAIA